MKLSFLFQIVIFQKTKNKNNGKSTFLWVCGPLGEGLVGSWRPLGGHIGDVRGHVGDLWFHVGGLRFHVGCLGGPCWEPRRPSGACLGKSTNASGDSRANPGEFLSL